MTTHIEPFSLAAVPVFIKTAKVKYFPLVKDIKEQFFTITLS